MATLQITFCLGQQGTTKTSYKMVWKIYHPIICGKNIEGHPNAFLILWRTATYINNCSGSSGE